MRTALILLGMGIGLLWSCKPGTPKANIETLEAEYRQLAQQAGDDTEAIRTAVRQLADAYVAEAESQSDETLASEYIYKAAELYENNLSDPNEALRMFDRIIEKYPDGARAADALFKKGYVLHNILQDTARARQVYVAFIDKYPDHDLVASARFEIENLGVDPAELLMRIKQDSLRFLDDPDSL
ncbi:MAG: hypothetical protein OHK0039_45730 [Bacteroidia bacterium]